MRTTITIAAMALALAAGCSSDNDSDSNDGSGDDVSGSQSPLQCDTSTYVAFDSVNHANQDIRLDTHVQMNEAMTSEDDPAVMFAAAKELYMDLNASADLRDKILGRVDQHVAGDPLQGDRIDETIVKWLEYGETAESALEASIAKQWIDKTLIEFFYLSVHHEFLEGTRKNWDEAFGYYGSGVDNDEADLRGMAAVAMKRDGTNGTNLEAQIYNGLIDGSCIVETELTAADIEQLDVSDVPELESLVGDMDLAMQEVLAYSAGHEAFEMDELLQAEEIDTDEIFIKAAELIPYFMPIERVMLDKGGESAERAEEIRGYLDAMPVSDPEALDVTDTAWIDELGDAPSRIIELLEAEYGIDIKG